MHPIRAILFDVFGTVVDWRGGVIADLSAWGHTQGLTADWAGFADAWRGAYAPSMDRVRRGERPWTMLEDLQRATLRDLAPGFGLSLDAAQLEHVNLVWRRLPPWPDSAAGLGALKRRFPICTLSNGNVALLLEMARRGGLPWDMVFGADIFRHYKPDPETYLGACHLLGLPPAQVMMAAAHPSDLAAAAALGLRTAFIARPEEFGPGGRADPGGTWDIAVASIPELASRLDA